MSNTEHKTWLDLITTCIKVVVIFIVCLVLLVVSAVGKAQAKAAPSDGICETIIVDKGEVISMKEYPCEEDNS